MKLPTLPTLRKKEDNSARPFTVKVNVHAADDKEALEMQEALQSFVSHFSVSEMKSAAHKLKSVANRKMIKTFL